MNHLGKNTNVFWIFIKTVIHSTLFFKRESSSSRRDSENSEKISAEVQVWEFRKSQPQQYFFWKTPFVFYFYTEYFSNKILYFSEYPTPAVFCWKGRWWIVVVENDKSEHRGWISVGRRASLLPDLQYLVPS